MFFKPILPAVEYVVLYDYIKNELCVNKSKPELECNGKCHLKKELAKAAAGNEKEKVHTFSVESSVAFCEAVYTDFCFILIDDFPSQKLFSYNTTYRFCFSQLLFRPPVS